MKPAVGRDEDRHEAPRLYPSAHLPCLMRDLFYYYKNPRQRWQIARTWMRILRSDIREIRSAEKHIRYTLNFEWSSARVQVSVVEIWCSTPKDFLSFSFFIFPQYKLTRKDKTLGEKFFVDTFVKTNYFIKSTDTFMRLKLLFTDCTN